MPIKTIIVAGIDRAELLSAAMVSSIRSEFGADVIILSAKEVVKRGCVKIF